MLHAVMQYTLNKTALEKAIKDTQKMKKRSPKLK